jgi:hypothetical protein
MLSDEAPAERCCKSAAAWAVWTYGGMKAAEMDWWSFFWVLPVLMPLGTAGRRTWNDSEPGPKK